MSDDLDVQSFDAPPGRRSRRELISFHISRFAKRNGLTTTTVF